MGEVIIMLEKCPECGKDLKDNSIVVWKCNNCNKSFKGSSQFLQNLQKKKKDNPGKSLLKCNNCSNWLDDGKEDISVQCSSCGNVIKGNLGYFIGKKEKTNIKHFNKNTIKEDKFGNGLINKRNFSINKGKIFLLLFISIILAIPFLNSFFKQKKLESNFLQSRKNYENMVKQLQKDDLDNHEYINLLSINTDFELKTKNFKAKDIEQDDIINIDVILYDNFEKIKLKNKYNILYRINSAICNSLYNAKDNTGYSNLENSYTKYKKQNIYTDENLTINYKTTFNEYELGEYFFYIIPQNETEHKYYTVEREGEKIVSIKEYREDEDIFDETDSWDKIDETENYQNLTYYKVTDDSELKEAWVMAQELVKNHLKSPTSAKFPYYKNDNLSIKKSGNYYEIVGYVDAENSFGVEIRTAFSLIMEKTGNSYVEKEYFFLE